MAGSISLSLSQQFDELGRPLTGGQLSFYQSGTVATKQNAFQDYGLTIPHPNPITLDAAGRVPLLYFADGFIKYALADSNGLSQASADNILVVGPSSGGGGGGGVDPTTIIQTGDLKLRYGTGVISGFVRSNGRTIGSATSGATERANADTAALFTFLYGQDINLPVSGGRGASAAADFAANKTIQLPDFRGNVPAGLDDMGNVSAGNLSGFMVPSSTTLGATGGAKTITLTLTQIPAGIISTNPAAIALNVSTSGADIIKGALTAGNSGTPLFGGAAHGDVASSGTIPIGQASVTSTNTLGADHINIQPTKLITIYVKL